MSYTGWGKKTSHISLFEKIDKKSFCENFIRYLTMLHDCHFVQTIFWRSGERFGDRKMDSLPISIFSGVRTLFGLPGGFRLSAEPVALKFSTQRSTVFRSGTGSRRLSWKWFLKFLKAAVTDSPLVRKFSTINARCFPVQVIFRHQKIQ